VISPPCIILGLVSWSFGIFFLSWLRCGPSSLVLSLAITLLCWIWYDRRARSHLGALDLVGVNLSCWMRRFGGCVCISIRVSLAVPMELDHSISTLYS